VVQRNSSLPGPLAFAVAVIALGSGWYLESRARAQDAARFDARLARLDQSADAAVGRVRDPLDTKSVSIVPRGLVAPGAPASAGRGGPGLVPVLSREENRRLQEQALSKLESRLSADGYDPRWAATTESDVAKAVAEPALAAIPAPGASDVHCARSMCRLVFAFDSLDQAEDWLTYYPLGVTQDLPVFQSLSTVRPDGRVELRMYGFRDRHTKLD
jgi:hypothetical protein